MSQDEAPARLGNEPAPDVAQASDPYDRSLLEDAQGLVGIAREYGKAEAAFQKSRASYAAELAKNIAVFAIVAAVLLFFMVMGLVFGLIFALAPWLTPWGSTAVVCGALLLGTVLAALRVRSSIRSLTRVFKAA